MPERYSIDHIVLAVADVEKSCEFYRRLLRIPAEQDQFGKWSLRVGSQKINLQPKHNLPAIAANTSAGSGNFCLLTTTPLDKIINRLKDDQVDILLGPATKVGANGPLLSVYFNDLDANLVEVSNQIEPKPAGN